MASYVSMACLVVTSLLLVSASHHSGGKHSISEYDLSVDQFTGHFYTEAAKLNRNQNVIVSGISADVVLGMAAMAATGQTKTEIEYALVLPSIDKALPSIKATLDSINNPANVTLRIANKIYAKPGSHGKLDSISRSYRSTIEDYFRSEVEQVVFSDNVQTAAKINRWVEDQTNQRIKDLVDADSLNGLTAAVMINAIYFKGSWDEKFDETATKEAKFTAGDGKVVKVDMMTKQTNYMYKKSEELDAQMILLSYKNEDMKMLVILPNQADGIEVLENKLSNGTKKFMNDMYSAEVELKLPRFKIETKIDVKDVLDKLGVKRLFTPTAELGLMMNGEPLYVSKAIQKAFIEVNEEGAEAAAATAFGFVTYALPMPKSIVLFHADHPFYFSLQYKDTTLFTGAFKSG